MKIEQREIGDVMVLSISGDITLTVTGATELTDTIRGELQQGQDRFLLDVGRVRYVDSFGLGELVHAFSAVRNRGGAMKLVNVTRRLNDLLVLTRLLTVFDRFDEESEALASFGPRPVARWRRS
jgi:anti-sigma B factor antagonist